MDKITNLKDFYNLMNITRDLRIKLVELYTNKSISLGLWNGIGDIKNNEVPPPNKT